MQLEFPSQTGLFLLAMSKYPDYPGLSDFVDAYGKWRFRYRHKGRTKAIPYSPGHPIFEEFYRAAVEGRDPKKAIVILHPNAALPRTLGAAWKLVQKISPEWKILDPATMANNLRLADEFLNSKVVETDPTLWKDIPVADLKRRHIKGILADRIDTPHKAKHLLTTIRKMITIALDEEWIEHDPTYRIIWRPKTTPIRSWTYQELTVFMEYWGQGTQQRNVFSIALWLGLRRVDIPNLRWDNIDFDRKRVETDIIKGDKYAVLKMAPMLISDLEQAPRTCDVVVLSAYGKPLAAKSLTNLMRKWTAKAGLPQGCTLHGLRKTLGKLATEGGATTRMSMELLLHDDIDHVELYSRDASQEKLAAEALDCAVIAFDRSMAKTG